MSILYIGLLKQSSSGRKKYDWGSHTQIPLAYWKNDSQLKTFGNQPLSSMNIMTILSQFTI